MVSGPFKVGSFCLCRCKHDGCVAVCSDREWLCSFGVAVAEPELVHPTRAAGPAETMVYASLSPALPQSQHQRVSSPAPCVLRGLWGGTPAGSNPRKGTPRSREVVVAQGPPQTAKIIVMLVAQVSKHSMGMGCFAPARSPCWCPGACSGLAQPCCSHGSLWRQTARVCVCAAHIPNWVGPKNFVAMNGR